MTFSPRGAARLLVSARASILVAIAFGTFLSLTGCDPVDPNPPRTDACLDNEAPPEDGAETVILGTTQGGTFVPLKSLDEVTLIHGPQGGQHIYVSTKLYALTAGQWQHLFEFYESESGLKAGGSRDLLTACASGWTVSHNIRVYIDDDSIDQGTVKLETFLPVELGGSSVKTECEIKLVD